MDLALPQLELQQSKFLERFGFSDVEVLSTLNGGMFSRPILLNADGRQMLLRIHTFRTTPEKFQFQAEAVNGAADRGIPCSRIIPTDDGVWCQPLPDQAGVLAMHEFVAGDVFDWSAWHQRKESSPQFLRRLGAHVAKLHDALRRTSPAGDSELPTHLPPIQFQRLSRIRAHWNDDLQMLRARRPQSKSIQLLIRFSSQIDEYWRRMATVMDNRVGVLALQVVHGDISPVNLVSGVDQQFYFIDWDCVHLGNRLYDALGDIVNRPPSDRPDLNRFRADHVARYLEGYCATTEFPLTSAELDLVPWFCLARQLEDLRQRAQAAPKLSEESDVEYATLIEMRVAMMEQIIEVTS
jgi:Ser/Thr protein kinase RdoA (MazF antagonist)